jgi:Methyltransferase domain
MIDELLLFSMAEFECITMPIVDEVNPTHIVEIGCGRDALNTRILLDYCRHHNIRFTAIERKPSNLLRKIIATYSQATLLEGLSEDLIKEISDGDIFFVDADHNYYSVKMELESIYSMSNPSIVFVHDTEWPTKRRDGYKVKSNIPIEFKQEVESRLGWGITVDNESTVFGGWRTPNNSIVYAKNEGGERNGVLTAIEDFMKHQENILLYNIPIIFGLGVFVDKRLPNSTAIASLLNPYTNNPLLARIEDNRMRLYLKLVELYNELENLRGNM